MRALFASTIRKTTMKKLVILIALIIAPLAAASQNNTDAIVNGVNAIIKLDSNLSITDVSNKRNHTYFVSDKEAIQLNHKKSNDLISIKSFRKTTQLRSRQTRRC